MKLYEVDKAIQSLLLQLEPDSETGEVPMDTDAICEELEGLQMERSRIMEYLAKLVLNIRADAASLKNEEARLRERRQSLERKDERLMMILDRECGGVKTDCGVATVAYRKTERAEISDNTRAFQWLRKNRYVNCYHIPKPDIYKTEVKKLIKSGKVIPGITLVQDVSCSLK